MQTGPRGPRGSAQRRWRQALRRHGGCLACAARSLRLAHSTGQGAVKRHKDVAMLYKPNVHPEHRFVMLAKRSIEEMEGAVRRNGYNLSATARELGISRQRVHQIAQRMLLSYRGKKRWNGRR